MNKQEIEKAIPVLKKYHDLLHEVYADYAVYSKAENYNDKSFELASRANTVKHACGTAITCMEQQLNNGWIPGQKETCEWVLEDDDCNTWQCNKCGALWVLSAGSPQDNDMHYCPVCGRAIIQSPNEIQPH